MLKEFKTIVLPIVAIILFFAGYIAISIAILIYVAFSIQSYFKADLNRQEYYKTTHHESIEVGNNLPREIKVVGVSFGNEDGSSRQHILSKLKSGSVVSIEHRPTEEYPHRISVISEFGCIGNLPNNYSKLLLVDSLNFKYGTIVSIGSGKGNLLGATILLKEVKEEKPKKTSDFETKRSFVTADENIINFPCKIKIECLVKSDFIEWVDEERMKNALDWILSEPKFFHYRLVREPDNQRSSYMVKLYAQDCQAYEVGEIPDRYKKVLSNMLDNDQEIIVTEVIISRKAEHLNLEFEIIIDRFQKPKREISFSNAREFNTEPPNPHEIDEERFWFGTSGGGWSVLDRKALLKGSEPKHVWYIFYGTDDEIKVSFDLDASKHPTFSNHTPHTNSFMQKYKKRSDVIWKYFCDNYERIVHELAIFKLKKETPLKPANYPIKIFKEDIDLIASLPVVREEEEFPPIERPFEDFSYYFIKYTKYVDETKKMESIPLSFSDYLKEKNSFRLMMRERYGG